MLRIQFSCLRSGPFSQHACGQMGRNTKFHHSLTNTNENKRRLGIFAKFWAPGEVKTRLAKSIGSKQASELYRAFLIHSVEQLRKFDAERVICFSPETARDAFSNISNNEWQLFLQPEGDLGQRLASFFRESFDDASDSGPSGPDRVVVLGTDSPTLPLARIQAAFDRLEGTDVVIGPSTDGGYYLIGLSADRPSLFEGIPWSTSHVLNATIDRCLANKWTYALLPPWRDVDELEDLIWLRASLSQGRTTEQQRYLLELIDQCLADENDG